jgi:amidase
VEAAIERIERIDPAINAVVIRWLDDARETAASADLPNGPFRGVPFLIKDLFATYAGQRISNGNVAFKEAHVIADADTTLVSRHRAAGLVIAGRTNSPELGSVPTTEPVAWGATHNPWDTTRTPGGSSGGAAAAVASGMVPTPVTAADQSASLRLVAASSVSSRVRVASRSAHSATKPDSRSSTASAAPFVTRRHCSTLHAARASATP